MYHRRVFLYAAPMSNSFSIFDLDGTPVNGFP